MQNSTDKFSHIRFAGAPASAPSRSRHDQLRPQALATRRPQRQIQIPADESSFLDQILRHANLDPASYRDSALARRIPACLRSLRVPTLAAAVELLAARPELLDSLVNIVLIGVTDFFRDEEPHTHLRRSIFPQLLETSTAPRILSAACSDGAELYTLALCLAEQGRLAGAELVGIDCRKRALELAADGFYPSASVRAVPTPFRGDFFLPDRGGYRVIESLRSQMQWRCQDLCQLPADPPFDFIACRNMAIYLDPAAAERLWQRLHAALVPGGILFVGKAERPQPDFDRIAPCLFKKVG